MKTIKRTIALIMIIGIALQMFAMSVSAATNRVTLTVTGNTYVGSTITVKIVPYTTESGGIGSVADSMLTYNSSILTLISYGEEATPIPGGQVVFDYSPDYKGTSSVTFTLKFKVIKEGSTTLKFTGSIVNWHEATDEPISDSKTIKAIDKSKLPSDATLKSLKISAGTLSPSFSSSVTSYSVTVPYDTTKVLVTAVTNDSKATSSVSGSATMKVGKNTRVVTVTAQNGSTKKYTINITRQPDPNATSSNTSSEPTEPQVNIYEVTIDGAKWTLLNDYALITPPTDYEIKTEVINETEMPVLKHKQNGRTLVYAVNDETDMGEYFVYDTTHSTYTPYKFFVTDSTTYVIVEAKDKRPAPKGFVLEKTEVMGYEIDAYKYTDVIYSDYVIFYAESPDGTKNYYRYDSAENTIQRATDFLAALGLVEAPTEQPTVATGNIWEKFLATEREDKIIVCAVALFFLLLIVLLVLNIVKLCSGRKAKKAHSEEFEYDNYAEITEFDQSIGEMNEDDSE